MSTPQRCIAYFDCQIDYRSVDARCDGLFQPMSCYLSHHDVDLTALERFIAVCVRSSEPRL
jgi:hypothetical protein